MSAYVKNVFYRWDIYIVNVSNFLHDGGVLSLYSFDVLYINIEPSKNIAVSPQLTWLMFKPKSKKSASCQERSLSCAAVAQLFSCRSTVSYSHSPVSHLSAKKSLIAKYVSLPMSGNRSSYKAGTCAWFDIVHVSRSPCCHSSFSWSNVSQLSEPTWKLSFTCYSHSRVAIYLLICQLSMYNVNVSFTVLCLTVTQWLSFHMYCNC